MQTDGIDKIAVSPILENMFQYLEVDLIRNSRRYRKLEREMRLRVALSVFFNRGLARLAEAQPLPMWVPTRDLMDALETSRLTTAVEPLLVPSCMDSCGNEVRRFHEYAMDLTSRFEYLPAYIAQMRRAMGMCELGWAKLRREDGWLWWKITKLGIENMDNGTFAKLAFSPTWSKLTGGWLTED